MATAVIKRSLLRWASPASMGTAASLPLFPAEGWRIVVILGAALVLAPDLSGQASELLLEAARRIGAGEPAEVNDGPARLAGPGAHEHPTAPHQEGQKQAPENRDPGDQGGQLPGIVGDRQADPLLVTG